MAKMLRLFLVLLTVFTSMPPQPSRAAFPVIPVGFSGTNAVVPDVPITGNERAVAKGGAIATTTQSSPSSYTRLECRFKVTIGREAAQNIRLESWNGYVSNGEQNAANDITIRYSLERVSGGSQTVPFHFSGSATSKTLTPNQYVITEPINSSAFGLSNFAAGSQWRVRLDLTVPASSKWPYNYEGVSNTTGFEVTSGETLCVQSNSASSQVLNTGNLSTPSGGATTLAAFGPTVIAGDWVSTPDVSVMIAGDSVTYNQADGQDTGIDHGGFINRGLRQATGGQIASSTFARSSESAQAWATDSAYRQSAMKYFTHWHDHLGGADGLAGRTQAQIIADLKTVWDDFKTQAGEPQFISHSQIQPATTSASGNWTSAGDQTCISPVSCAGQLRDLTNAEVLTLEGDADGPDAVFDPNTVWEDQANLTKWVSTGAADYATNDGRHPSSIMHDYAGDDFADFVDANYFAGVPTNTVAPAATGSPYVGQTLSCSTGTWTGSPSGYTYTWEENGTPIGGATSSTFVITNDQLGDNVGCNVVATNGSGNANADSNVIDVFTPTDIANMVAWYDASQTSSITSSSGAVSAWTNLVSGANTCTATSTAQPTTGTVTINGRNAIDFDGTTDRLTCGANWGSSLLNDSDGATVRFIAATDTPNTAAQYLWSCQLSTSTIGGSGIGYINPTYKAQAASGNGLAEYVVSSTTAVHDIAYRRGFGSAGTTQVIYDGVATSGTTSTNYTNTACTIGNDGGGTPGKWWNGAMGEGFVYSRALTNAEMNTLGAYTASKWGLTWTTLVWNWLMVPRYANDNDWLMPYREVAANDNDGDRRKVAAR